jgi:hypothetical protein
LTAIFDDTKSSKGVGASKLVFSAKNHETRKLISQKRLELLRVFENRKEINDAPQAGIDATSFVSSFAFEFGLMGKSPCIDLNINDYPGEYLLSNPEIVNKFIAESTAILIAIDSPYLMEENGKYNEEKNQVKLVYDFIKTNLETVSNNKLVMLMPLKCEKYYYENRMDELNTKVRSIYRDSISLLQPKKNVAMVISPILTMGGVVFDYFENTHEGHIAHYKFRDNLAKYTPMFCVQPVYYTLLFIAKLYELNKMSNSGFFGSILKSIASFFSSDREMFNEVLKLNQYRLEDINGYSILNGDNLFYKK